MRMIISTQHRLILGPALFCLLYCQQAPAQHEPPEYLMHQMSQIFLTDPRRLQSECEREPYADVRQLSLFEKRIGRRELREIHKELLRAVDRLVSDKRFLLFETLKTSPKLASIRHIKIDVASNDIPYASADPPNTTISIFTGLLKKDLEEVISSPAPLCSIFHFHFNDSRGQEFDRAQLNTIGAAFEFVVAFQILHEIGHVVLRHTVVNQKCEESEADHFALNYLYAIRNVILMFPKAYLPLDSMWPPYPNVPSPSESNYPTRPDREDQAWRTRVLRNMAFGAIASDKLNVLGAIVGTSLMDADVYEANFSLEQSLKIGTACHSSASSDRPSRPND
jgi:hypothetical protein